MANVGIVGGGIAGATTAAVLQKSGHDVTLYERADVLREVGAGFTIQPNGLKLLATLGIQREIEEEASPIPHSVVRDKCGEIVPVDIINLLANGNHSYSIHRSDLHNIILGLLENVRIILGTAVEKTVECGESVTVVSSGHAVGEHEYVIGADGIKSVVQKSLGNITEASSEGIMALRGLVPTHKVDWASEEHRMGVWLGDGKTLLAYRVRRGSMMNIAAYVPTDRNLAESWSAPSSREEALRIFDGWDGRVVQMMDQITECFKWGIYDRSGLDRWASRRTALIGDAAHAMVPYLGQGANQAIQDAFCIGQVIDGSGKDGLVEYERRRRPEAESIQVRSRQAGLIFRDYENNNSIAKAEKIVEFTAGASREIYGAIR